MKELNIIELLEILLGSVEPYAETNIDRQHLQNLKEWCELHRKITEKIEKVANACENLKSYKSANALIEESRFYLNDIKESIEVWGENW